MSDDAGNANPEDGKQQEAPAASEHLNLKVKSQDGNEVYFKVRPHASDRHTKEGAERRMRSIDRACSWLRPLLSIHACSH